jgi:hypothetical protein
MAAARTFPYLALGSNPHSPPGRAADPNGLCPALDIRLIGRDGLEVPTRAVIDSGASASCFPIALADQLGIEISQCRETRAATAGGPALQYEWNGGLIADVAGQRLALRAIFAPTKVALLGRADFFDAFLVSFNHRERTFMLKRMSKGGMTAWRARSFVGRMLRI